MAQNKLNLEFTHPKHSERTYVAQVAPECTSEHAITGLQNVKFLDPAPTGSPYELVHARTSQRLTPTTTIAQVGAAEGDKFEVRQSGNGA